MTTTNFYIQWREQTGGSGTFVGGTTNQSSDWLPLSGLRLNKNTSYEFHLSVSGVTSDRFISLTEGGGPRIGVRLGPTNGATNPVAVSLTLGDKGLKVMAALLGAFDPKFPTTWGKGGTTKVTANWSGQVWTLAKDGGPPQTGTDMSMPVSTGTSIEFVIKDASSPKHWAALIVLPSTDAVQSTILHETDLGTKSDSSDTYTVTQPTGATTTLFGLNLYELLATTAVTLS